MKTIAGIARREPTFTLRGIETLLALAAFQTALCREPTFTLRGIETINASICCVHTACREPTFTLRGVEIAGDSPHSLPLYIVEAIELFFEGLQHIGDQLNDNGFQCDRPTYP